MLFILMFALLIALNVSCAENNLNDITGSQRALINDAVSGFMLTYNVPAVILGVWEEGKEPFILVRGKADLETGRAVEAGDHFRIASITKTFTATVMLQLIEEGRISFEATIDAYFPEITNADRITVRQVLAMTAGIYDLVNSAEFNRLYYADITRVWTHDEIMALINDQPADFEPGTACKYSNSNYYLLGLMIERLTGNKAEDEIKTRIIDRLGLAGTSFPAGTGMPDPYCHGYNNMATLGVGELTDVSIQSPSGPWTSGGMISTISDLRTWVEALYFGTLLSAETQAARLTWNVLQGSGGKFEYGLGIANLLGLIGHNGEIEGYNTDMYYLPAQKATIVCLSNNASNQYGHTIHLTKQVIDILYPGAVNW